MKICPCCTAQLDDDAQFCRNCGAVQPDAERLFAQPAPVEEPYDHTKEFDAQDVAAGKLPAMLVYLLSVVGILLAQLTAKDSPYVSFHIRQGMKFLVAEVLVGLAAAVLCWTVLVPIVAAVAMVVLVVVRFVCFVQVCQGKALEPAIIRSIGFLK